MIKNFEKDENHMNMEISGRTSAEIFSFPEERQYVVESSGASASAGYSISLLHQYCSKLPHDEYVFQHLISTYVSKSLFQPLNFYRHSIVCVCCVGELTPQELYLKQCLPAKWQIYGDAPSLLVTCYVIGSV